MWAELCRKLFVAGAVISLFSKTSSQAMGPTHPPTKRVKLVENSDPYNAQVNTLRTGSFKLFKRPFPGLLTILTL
jgi:hypothetical protein